MGREKVSKEKKNKKIEKRKKVTVKTYLRDFLLFVDKNMLKTIGILMIVAVLIIALSIKPAVTAVLAEECEGACRDGITLMSDYWSKIQVLLVTGVAGIVPYMFAPVVGFIGYILSEVGTFAYVIKGYGYGVGLLIEIVPIIINILTISIVTALGIYICRLVTVSYRMSNVKNMNLLNFRIRLYETLQKEAKVKELTAKKEKKLEKLESQKQKINYLQILNLTVVVCVLQFISVLIQQILL